MSKVSCCVEPSYCFRNSDFDASVKVPLELPLKMSLPENENTVNLKSASFVVIMLLHEGFDSCTLTKTLTLSAQSLVEVAVTVGLSVSNSSKLSCVMS